MDREPYVLNSQARAKSVEQASPRSAVDEALAMAREQDLQSPLEKRMTSVRSTVEMISIEVGELAEKLGPLLIEKPAIKVTTVKPLEERSPEAPLIAQLDVLQDQLHRIKDELHLLRCRACC